MAIFNSKLLVITRGFSAISARDLHPTWPCVVEDLKGHVPASASVAKPMEFPAVHPQQSWNRWDLWWFTMILWWYYDDFWGWFMSFVPPTMVHRFWSIPIRIAISAPNRSLHSPLDSQRDSNEMIKSNLKEYLMADFADFDMTCFG